MKSYLQWLADSENKRSSKLGQWYLENLKFESPPSPVFDFNSSSTDGDENKQKSTSSITVWTDPEIDQFKPLIEVARLKLAEVETEYGVLKSKIDKTRSVIFKSLRPLYEKIDTIKLKIQYRRIFLDTLLQEGEEETENFEEQYQQAEQEKYDKYEKTEADLSSKTGLSEEEKIDFQKYGRNSSVSFIRQGIKTTRTKEKEYEELTAMINRAKEDGDLRNPRRDC